LEHINNKNILVKETFGIRCKLSIEAAIHSLVSKIFIVLNKKNILRGIFGKLTKIFFCVNHGILLSK